MSFSDNHHQLQHEIMNLSPSNSSSPKRALGSGSSSTSSKVHQKPPQRDYDCVLKSSTTKHNRMPSLIAVSSSSLPLSSSSLNQTPKGRQITTTTTTLLLFPHGQDDQHHNHGHHGDHYQQPKQANKIRSSASGFSCNHCHKKFHSAQALGGHQNAHRRERTTVNSLAQNRLQHYQSYNGEAATAAASFTTSNLHHHHHHYRYRPFSSSMDNSPLPVFHGGINHPPSSLPSPSHLNRHHGLLSRPPMGHHQQAAAIGVHISDGSSVPSRPAPSFSVYSHTWTYTVGSSAQPDEVATACLAEGGRLITSNQEELQKLDLSLKL